MAVGSWFIYIFRTTIADWSFSIGLIFIAIIGFVILVPYILGGLLLIFLAFANIIIGLWMLLTGSRDELDDSDKKSDKYDASPDDLKPYGFTQWSNAIGSLLFGLVGVSIGVFLIGLALMSLSGEPFPENVHTGSDDPIIIVGFCLFWNITCLFILIKGLRETFKGISQLLKSRIRHGG